MTLCFDQGGGRTETVSLKRMAIAVVADRVALYESFAKLTNRARMHKDKEFSALVSTTLDLWAKMVNAGAAQSAHVNSVAFEI